MIEWTSWHERHADKIELIAGVDCWIWIAATGGGGYGRVKYGPGAEFAHRAAFIEANGRKPNGLVRHTCGNRCCIRPGHLVEGTHADNSKDAALMFTLRGHLTEADVIKIRQSYAAGIPLAQIADSFGVAYGTVYPIVTGRAYKHVSFAVPLAQRTPRKLTTETAQQIRALALAGDMSQKEIGAQFGVNQSVVARIKSGDRWAEIGV